MHSSLIHANFLVQKVKKMGFKKEKLLSGLLARNLSDSQKEEQEHSLPVLSPKANNVLPEKSTSSPPSSKNSARTHSGAVSVSDRVQTDMVNVSPQSGKTGDHQNQADRYKVPKDGRGQDLHGEFEGKSKARELDSEDPITDKCQSMPLISPCGIQYKDDASRPVALPETCSSLDPELTSAPGTEVEVNSLATNERHSAKNALKPHHDLNTAKDSSKLSVILSYTIPLSSHSTDGDPSPSHCDVIANVHCVHTNGPSTPLTYHHRPRNDHDYCIQNFSSSTPLETSVNTLQDESYSFCLSDYSTCSTTTATPSITWGYQPGTVTAYQVHPVQKNSTVRLFEPATCHTSGSWYLNLDTRDDIRMVALHNIGLTKINLERLAETGSISESLFAPEKSRTEERSDRVKERRETFIGVMQEVNNSYKKEQHRGFYEHIARNNPIVGKWMKLDTLDVHEISKLLDDTADVLYRRKEEAARRRLINVCGDISSVRRRLLCSSINNQDHGETSVVGKQSPSLHGTSLSLRRPPAQDITLTRTRARVISSARRQLHYNDNQPRCHDTMESRRKQEPTVSPQNNNVHQKIRRLIAKSLASTKSTSEERGIHTKKHVVDGTIYANPPVWERSRSVSSRENGTTSLAAQGDVRGSSKQETKKLGTGRRDKATNSQAPCRSLRSRTINLTAKTRQPVKVVHGRVEAMVEQVHGRMEEREQGNGNSKWSNANDADWIKLSEEWMNEPLNNATLLTLI